MGTNNEPHSDILTEISGIRELMGRLTRLEMVGSAVDPGKALLARNTITAVNLKLDAMESYLKQPTTMRT